MTRGALISSVRSWLLAAPPAVVVAAAMTLSACSGDGPDPAPSAPTASVSTEPTASSTESSPASPTEAPTHAPTTEPAAPTSPTSEPTASVSTEPTADPAPTAGGSATDLAALLPEGFPIPDQATLTGDPSRTDEQTSVSFTVPDPAATFEFFATELPEAGYELLPGSSDHYSTEVASGAILAQSEDYALNLLIVDDEVQVGLTRR